MPTAASACTTVWSFGTTTMRPELASLHLEARVGRPTVDFGRRTRSAAAARPAASARCPATSLHEALGPAHVEVRAGFGSPGAG